MTQNYLIVDCFVDEPACFGVPPFISPYPRYVFGALVDSGVKKDTIIYTTIDSIRDTLYKVHEQYNHVFLIGGAVVPGKYLGARIGSVNEISRIIQGNEHLNFSLGGMIRFMMPEKYTNLTPVHNDIEAFAYTLVKGMPEDKKSSYQEIGRWSMIGASVVKKHPDYPHCIAEIETYRGCPRSQHCSFCSESLSGAVSCRPIKDITSEIDALISAGLSRFRLGKQADILLYGSSCSEYRHSFPRPDTGPPRELFNELKGKKESGRILLLNVDNANPGTIAHFPDESSQILEHIADAITPGDTLALGIESFDEDVMARNNLKVTGEQAIQAVEIINSIGSKRIQGIPVLLPGINLIHGLSGESMKTFETNYQWLMKILEKGLLVKRINIRSLLPFPGTVLHDSIPSVPHKVRNRFEYYRERIRHDVDRVMLKKIYPQGTVLNDIHILDTRDGYSLGKQIASYSITVKTPGELPLRSFSDIIVTGHRERSLAGLPIPININTVSQKAIESIPGISKKRASEIIIRRPFSTVDEVKGLLNDTDSIFLNNITCI